MQHCLKAETWVQFLEGELGAEEMGGVERHLAACPQCRLLASSYAWLETALTDAAVRERERAEMAPAAIRLALSRVQEKLLEQSGITLRLEALRFFVDGMLGEAASAKVLRVAARREEVDERGWMEFIGNLTEMIGDLCGDGAGAIVSYIGRLPEPLTV